MWLPSIYYHCRALAMHVSEWTYLCVQCQKPRNRESFRCGVPLPEMRGNTSECATHARHTTHARRHKWKNTFAVRVSTEVTSAQGRIQPVSLEGAISVIVGIQASFWVHYCKRDETILHSTAATKQWTAEWAYIANIVFRNEKIMVNKRTFVGFRGGNRLPLDPSLSQRHIKRKDRTLEIPPELKTGRNQTMPEVTWHLTAHCLFRNCYRGNGQAVAHILHKTVTSQLFRTLTILSWAWLGATPLGVIGSINRVRGSAQWSSAPWQQSVVICSTRESFLIKLKWEPYRVNAKLAHWTLTFFDYLTTAVSIKEGEDDQEQDDYCHWDQNGHHDGVPADKRRGLTEVWLC